MKTVTMGMDEFNEKERKLEELQIELDNIKDKIPTLTISIENPDYWINAPWRTNINKYHTSDYFTEPEKELVRIIEEKELACYNMKMKFKLFVHAMVGLTKKEHKQFKFIVESCGSTWEDIVKRYTSGEFGDG